MTNELERILELGYCVVPLAKQSKIPVIQQWTRKASNNPSVVSAWANSFPECNWGLATGEKSGVVVIDIDPRHGGDIQWKRLTINKNIDTATCATGGGGMHYYFEIPEGVTINNAVLSSHPGIDIRGNGGQAVIPPSVHESGTRYAWTKPPWITPPALLPDWLLRIILDANAGTKIGGELVKGERNNSLFHEALMLARQGAEREFTIITLKTWRDQQSENFSDSEIETLVDSAYKRIDKEKAKSNSSMMEKTDADNADRFIQLYGDNLRYAGGIGWIEWSDGRWAVDDDNAGVTTLAIESMKMLRDEALQDARKPEQFKEALARAKWAMSSLNAGRLRSTIELAKANDKIRVEPNDLDSRNSRHLLNVKNGVVNLKTGELLPHDPDLLLTKIIDVEYKPNAPCPFWMKTLNLAFNNNTDLVDYMRRAVGYSITGSTAEQCLFICWGEEGNNGKSTILEALQRLLGDYGAMSDMKVITSSETDNRVASSLAKLPGVRLVSMNEAEENQRMSESLVKQITGGDTIQACKKFKEPFEFSPVFKLWIRTNEKPIIRSVGEAIWRRIRLIPFEIPIPPDARMSRDIVDDTIDNEAEGVLAWAVKGAIEWYAHGLQDPKDVTAATAGYRSEMDVVEAFFDECVVEEQGARVARGDLYQTFSRWCKENGLRYVMTSGSFGKRVGVRLNNTTRDKYRGQYVWNGIRLSEFATSAFIV